MSELASEPEGTADPTTFPELFAQVVRDRAEHPALIVAEETLSYAELDRRTAQVARALLASGAGKGTRIALLAPDGVLWLTTFYAALRIGALVTPISTLTTPPELAHILRTSDAQLLVGARGFLRRNFVTNLEAALPGLADAGPGPLRLPSAPHLRSVWLDDADGVAWASPVDDLLARAGEVDDELLTAVEREVSPADDAFVVYTSGSTAHPKAVVHGQASLVTKPAALAEIFLMTGDDRTMPLLPAFWLGGVAALLQVLSTGSTLVYPPSPDVDDVVDILERHDVTYVVVWHALAKLRAAAKARGIDVDRIRGLSGPRDAQGERIPVARQPNLLGMSESFSAHSGEPLDRPIPEDKQGASGRAINGVERRVVHLETGAEVPPGEVGELQLRGGGILAGFYKVPHEQVFTPDGFYPTKDLVRIDADGYLWFVGRIGDMIKTNSANVSRLEVEAALNTLPEVQLSLVAGLPDAELGEMVAAAVVPAPGAEPTEAQLREALRDRISGFKIPRRIVFITDDDVPRTPTGKVRLFDLAATIESRLPPSKGSEPRMAEKKQRPSAEEIVLYEKDKVSKIATITLDRPDDLNAMTIDAIHRYADLVHQANVDDDVKVLVIRANGPNLGTGADLPELMDVMGKRGEVDMKHVVRVPEDADVEYPFGGSYRYGATNVQYYTDPAAGMRSLQDFKKISILETRGYCYGWHFYQAADADLVISSDDTLFGHAAFRYAGWAARQWQWCTMMGVRKFMEMVFTGRPFTAAEMAECGFVNAVVPFDELEATTAKYAGACSKSVSNDTIFAQKTFFEIYKQQQGEYMGSVLSGMLESMGRLMKPDPETFEFTREMLDAGLTKSVRGNDENFPPEWRLSRRGRGEEQG